MPTVQINERIIRKFAHMFKVSLPTNDPGLFEYYMREMNPFFNTEKKWAAFRDAYERIGEDMFDLPYIVRRQMTRFIESHPSFEKLKSKDMLTTYIQGSNMYIEPNKDRLFISIDLNKANFQSIYLTDPTIFNGAHTFNEFVGQFSDEKILVESKILRQVFFGSLPTAMQHNTQKRFMLHIKSLLDLHYPELSERIRSLSTDEIFFDISQDEEFKAAEIEKMLKAETNYDLRVEMFYLRKPFVQDGYYKQYLNVEGRSIHRVDKDRMMQFIKMIDNRELEDEDLMFYANGKDLAKYIKPVFTPYE